MSTQQNDDYDPDERFATLRGFLNGPFVSYHALGMIYRLAITHHTHAPDSYHEQWVPYMRGYPKYWLYPLTTLRSITELQDTVEILPFARFNLNLNGTLGLSEDWPCVLAQTSALEHVHQLHLAHLRMSPAHLNTLINSVHLTTLQHLNVWNARLGPDGAEVLAQAQNMSSVEELQLGRNSIGPKGAEALAASPHLNHIKKAWLTYNEIRDRGATSLANAPELAALTELDLGSNIIGRRGAEAFAHAPRSRQLTNLTLTGNQLGERGERALANSRYLNDEIRKSWTRHS